MLTQSETDRIARQVALQRAIENANGADADVIVADATAFHAFLTNTNTEGK